MSQDALLYLSSSSREEDEEVRLQLLQLLPSSARAVLEHLAAASAPEPLSSSGSAAVSGGSLRATGSAGMTLAVGLRQQAAGQEGLAATTSLPLLLRRQQSPAAPGQDQAKQPGLPAQYISSARVLLGDPQVQQQQQQRSAAAAGLAGHNLLGLDFESGFDGDLVMLLRCAAEHAVSDVHAQL